MVSNQRLALLTLEADGQLAVYADLSALSGLGCNDIVVDGRGNAYVNSPNFDFATGPPDGPVQPGAVAVVKPDRTVRLVAQDIAFPNGMAVTADNATLVVADSYRHQLLAFTIEADGGLSARRVWADLGDAAPDGICLDAEAACWYADVPHQQCVRVAEGGRVLDTVSLDRGGFACMLGGAQGSALYVVAARWPGAAALREHTQWDGQVLRTRVSVPGAGYPAR
jgi:sugar lactone lactonase YvrE